MQQIGFLLRNLLFAQHVSGTITPIWCGAVGYMSGLGDAAAHHTRPTTSKRKSQVPQASATCITQELLMMGVMVPETC